MSLTVANYNPLHCCWCRTDWTERYLYGQLELIRDDAGNNFSPPRPAANYVWHYTGAQPEQYYIRINNRKICQYEYIPLKSSCNCTNGAGGTALDKEEVYEFTDEEDLGNITKRFPGAWIPRGQNFANATSIFYGHQLIAYAKKLYIDTYKARYYHMHWCGKTCPGAPLDPGRIFDKRAEFRLEAGRCQG